MKKSKHAKTRTGTHEPDLRHIVGPFDLEFLKPQGPRAVDCYEDALLTAEEKAAYYEDLIKNNGFEDSVKIAKDCRNKAAELRNKIDHINPDEALPLLEKVEWLESLARHYDDVLPPDVLASQVDDGLADIPITQDLGKIRSELGLETSGPKQGSDASPDPEIDDGDSEKMLKLKRKARFWKNIHSWNATEQIAYYFCGPSKPEDWIEAMFVRAQNCPTALKMISSPDRLMMRLLTLTEMGHEEAIREVVRSLEKYVRLLNLCAKINPHAFRKVASQLQSWPVVFSPHPRLNQMPQMIARQIALGAAIDFEFGPGAKWNPNDLGCKIAMELYAHIKKIRQYPESNAHLSIFEEVMKLPDIRQPGSVEPWWKVARSILLHSYPKPETNEILAKLTNIQDKFKARSKILETIENRFFSLFPKIVR